MSPTDASQPHGCAIRLAKPEDLNAVRDLIVELAVYENAPDQVTLTLEQLKRDAEEGCFEVTLRSPKTKALWGWRFITRDTAHGRGARGIWKIWW